jgi:hypothetical protein
LPSSGSATARSGGKAGFGMPARRAPRRGLPDLRVERGCQAQPLVTDQAMGAAGRCETRAMQRRPKIEVIVIEERGVRRRHRTCTEVGDQPAAGPEGAVHAGRDASRPAVRSKVRQRRGAVSPCCLVSGSGQQLTAHTNPGAEVRLGSAVALVCCGTHGEHAGSDKRSPQSSDRRATADRWPTIPSCGRKPSIVYVGPICGAPPSALRDSSSGSARAYWSDVSPE